MCDLAMRRATLARLEKPLDGREKYLLETNLCGFPNFLLLLRA